EAEYLSLLALFADAAAGINSPIGNRRARVDVVRPVKVPALCPGPGVKTVKAIIARPEEYFAIPDTRARFDVSPGLELPGLVPIGRVEAIELADQVAVHPFADVEAAIGQAWGRVHGQHPAAIVELPDLFAGFPIQAVEGAAAGKAGAM